MAHRRSAAPIAIGTLTLLAACGGDAPGAAEAGPLALASDVPFCQSVVEAVHAYYESESAANPMPDDPRYGGTVVVAGGGDLGGGLLTFTTSDQTTQETELHLVHSTLLRMGADLELAGYLAESWEEEPDGTGVTFRLRRDMRWHDGRSVTAADVAFTFERAMDPVVQFANAPWFDPFDRSGIEVVDDYTIRFAFEPHAEALQPFANLPIMPAHLLGTVPPAELAEHPFATECPVGSGPYLFESTTPGDRWVLRGNPGYPESLGGRPFLDRYVYRVITSSATRAGEVVAGGADVALALAPPDVPMVQDNPGVTLTVAPTRSYAFVGWNTALPQLSDARVRMAMALATDRRSLVRTLRGDDAILAETGVPAFHWAYDPTLEGPSYDPDGARALLDELGWEDRDGDGVREAADGTPLRFSVITNANNERESIGRILVDQLAEVGVAVDFEVLEMGSLQAQVTAVGQREFGGVILGFSTDFNIQESGFFHSRATELPYGWSALSDPELDRLLDTLPLIPTREEARPLWAEYQRRIVELQPFMYLYFSDRLNGVAGDLEGVEFDIRGDLMGVSSWYRNPDAR